MMYAIMYFRINKMGGEGMKYIKRFFIFMITLLIITVVINEKTDFFYNISAYIPSISEYPLVHQIIHDASEAVSDTMAQLPTPREIIAEIKNEPIPIAPEDIAHNNYIQDSSMLSFYPNENIGIVLNDDNTLNIFGTVQSQSKRYLIVNFSDDTDKELKQAYVRVNSNMQFNENISIPDSICDEIYITAFTGAREYGQYTSWVLNAMYLIRNENSQWTLKQSPVYDNNKFMYEADKSVSESLKRTPSIQCENESVISIAQELTANCTTDYEKAVALHDWICSYIYYDEDNLDDLSSIPYYATDVIGSKRAVCLGFATLYASLCRSINIPCNVVSGYALGIENDSEWSSETAATDYQNHAWNEAYVDGRWIIVDTTWDTQNKIRNGEWVQNGEPSHIYFDSNLYYFSQTHKILEYSKRR